MNMPGAVWRRSNACLGELEPDFWRTAVCDLVFPLRATVAPGPRLPNRIRSVEKTSFQLLCERGGRLATAHHSKPLIELRPSALSVASFLARSVHRCYQ
jgi:hypothetical protein